MFLSRGMAITFIALCVVVVVFFSSAAWPQTELDSYIESLTAEQVISGLVANLNLIRTYRATFVVSGPDGGNAREHIVGWERVPKGGSDLQDKRFYRISPEKGSNLFDSGYYDTQHGAYNGEKTFLHNIDRKGERDFSRGEILPSLDARMVALGLTLTALSTHFTDSAPIERVVKNGTFRKEGVESVNGRKCVAIYGEYCYAEPGPWQCKNDAGVYIKLLVDPLSGFMPLKQEWYAVQRKDGNLVRALFQTYVAQLEKHEGGIWFPTAGSLSYDGTNLVLKVKECALNVDIPPSEFAIANWPPGTHVEDRIANVSYTVPRPLPVDFAKIVDSTDSEVRAKEFQNLEKKLDEAAKDIMTHDAHVPEKVLADLEANRPRRIRSDIMAYMTAGALCAVVALVSYGMGRFWSKRRERRKAGSER